jgi:polyisoprenoid-binding protein YceI
MDAPASIRVDVANATVSFRVRWFGVIQVRGRFASVTGTVALTETVDDATVSMQVESASVRTGIALRDRHLRGHRFLDSDRHPEIRFESDQVRRHNGTWDIRGRLCLRGHQRDVWAAVVEEPSSGSNRRLTAEFSVPRHPHAIGTARGIRRLNPLLWAIGDDVTLRVELLVPATALQRMTVYAPAR